MNSDSHNTNNNSLFSSLSMTRREMLQRVGTGMGTLGLAGMMANELLESSAQASESKNPLAPKPAHFPAKAKHIIHLFMNGGPSQVDPGHHDRPLQQPSLIHILTLPTNRKV